jgi:hypothetical protein
VREVKGAVVSLGGLAFGTAVVSGSVVVVTWTVMGY